MIFRTLGIFKKINQIKGFNPSSPCKYDMSTLTYSAVGTLSKSYFNFPWSFPILLGSNKEKGRYIKPKKSTTCSHSNQHVSTKPTLRMKSRGDCTSEVKTKSGAAETT